MARWHRQSPGREPVGPTDAAELRAAWIRREIPPNTTVCAEGFSRWVPFDEVAELVAQPSPTTDADLRDFRGAVRSPGRSGTTIAIVVIGVLGAIAFLFVALVFAVIVLQGSPGRPLRIAGLRLVPLVRRGRTNRATGPRPVDPDVASLDPKTRRLLAKLWLVDARAEYASVAAFEHLALDLAAAMAPAYLVEWARRAALEEDGHATMCFAVSSAYAGRQIAPVPLPAFLLRARASRGDRPKLLERLAVESLVEGCVEEGLAARVAQVGAKHARDPVIARVLARIAQEEASHAALAYAVVSWAAREQPSVVASLAPALARSQRRRRASRNSENLLELGRVGGGRVDQLANHAYAEAHEHVSS